MCGFASQEIKETLILPYDRSLTRYRIVADDTQADEPTVVSTAANVAERTLANASFGLFCDNRRGLEIDHAGRLTNRHRSVL